MRRGPPLSAAHAARRCPAHQGAHATGVGALTHRLIERADHRWPRFSNWTVQPCTEQVRDATPAGPLIAARLRSNEPLDAPRERAPQDTPPRCPRPALRTQSSRCADSRPPRHFERPRPSTVGANRHHDEHHNAGITARTSSSSRVPSRARVFIVVHRDHGLDPPCTEDAVAARPFSSLGTSRGADPLANPRSARPCGSSPDHSDELLEGVMGDVARGCLAPRHPAPTRRPRDHLRISPRHRQHRDRRHRPRTPSADGPRSKPALQGARRVR